MAKVKFTAALKRFFPTLDEIEIEGNSIQEILNGVNKKYPGIDNYILEEDGSLRKHVNIFLENDMINDRKRLTDQVKSNDQILIFQALSGG
ncbi:MAG: MoaD/ThiS family protein [Cyclobacteriaceae bacterium]|nr:MoaD/ThiS family protein [Cyclobacteriaceae bacterium]